MKALRTFAVCLGLLSAGAVEAGQVNVTARLVKDGHNDPAIEFRVRNNADVPVEIYRADLPWGNAHSPLLVAIEVARHQQPLRRVFPIDDPGPLTVTIDPDEELSGVFRLVEIFPDIGNIDRELAVFWTYQPKSFQGEVVGPRVGGMILIPSNWSSDDSRSLGEQAPNQHDCPQENSANED